MSTTFDGCCPGGTDQVAVLGRELLAERRELGEVVGALDGRDWYRPAPAEGWVILDRVTALAYLDDVARAAIEGPVGILNRPGFSGDHDGVVAPRVLADYRNLRPRAVRSWLDEAGRTLVESALRTDPIRRVQWCGASVSVASCLAARLVDTWAFGQDVYDALGLRRPWSPLLPRVACMGVHSLAHNLHRLGLGAPASAVRLELGGWVHGPRDAANRVTGDLEGFCLLITKRRRRDDTNLVVIGDEAERWLMLVQSV